MPRKKPAEQKKTNLLIDRKRPKIIYLCTRLNDPSVYLELDGPGSAMPYAPGRKLISLDGKSETPEK